MSHITSKEVANLANLVTTVRQEITALRKNIEKQENALREAQKQLELHEKIAAMLQGGSTPTKATRRPYRKKALKAVKKK